MKRRWTSLVIAAALMTTATAHSFTDGCFNFDIGSGWRQDSLSYTATYPTYSQVNSLNGAEAAVARTNYVDNVQYKGLRSWNIGGKAEYKEYGLLFRVFGQYGALYSGHGTEFATSNPAATTRSSYNFQADRGEVFDFGAVMGIPLCSHAWGVEFTLTPLVGWSQHEQHLQQVNQENFVDLTLDTIQTLVGGAFPVRSVGANIPKIYNSYQTRWNGLYAGYDLAVEIPCTDLVVYTGFEWHFPTFRSRGQYNAPTTPIVAPDGTATGLTYNQQKINESQKDHGNGWVVRTGGEWFINRCWSVGLIGYYSRYWVAGGTQDATVQLPASLAGTKSVGTINNLEWTSWAIMGSLGYQF